MTWIVYLSSIVLIMAYCTVSGMLYHITSADNFEVVMSMGENIRLGNCFPTSRNLMRVFEDFDENVPAFLRYLVGKFQFLNKVNAVTILIFVAGYVLSKYMEPGTAAKELVKDEKKEKKEKKDEKNKNETDKKDGDEKEGAEKTPKDKKAD